MGLPQVVLATRNAHKLDELSRLLSASGVEVELLPVPSDAPEVAETESTFAGNALLKARSVSAHTGLPAIADDSGLCVDALNGMPGVLSARWAGGHGDDRGNLELVLGQIGDVPEGRRGAQFVCAAALVVPGDVVDERVVEGVVEGSLLTEPRGTNGFGYDPIFVPYGFAQTTAQMSAEQKDSISHRGQAMAALVPLIRDLVLGQPGA
jgi:XTP/dITP diphosphohydrolase